MLEKFDLELARQIIHYSLHFFAPGAISWFFFRSIWKKAWLIMIMTMLVDLDHLLANPIFDPNRCSIGFHVLHSYYAICIYILMLFFSRFRIVSIGLIFHMLTDYQDCIWSEYLQH